MIIEIDTVHNESRIEGGEAQSAPASPLVTLLLTHMLSKGARKEVLQLVAEIERIVEADRKLSEEFAAACPAASTDSLLEQLRDPEDAKYFEAGHNTLLYDCPYCGVSAANQAHRLACMQATVDEQQGAVRARFEKAHEDATDLFVAMNAEQDAKEREP